MQNPPDYRHDTVLPLPQAVTADAWAVDAACSGNPGPMEYQAIDLATGQRVFHFGPMKGTNNIGEFLAISMHWHCAGNGDCTIKPFTATPIMPSFGLISVNAKQN